MRAGQFVLPGSRFLSELRFDHAAYTLCSAGSRRSLRFLFEPVLG